MKERELKSENTRHVFFERKASRKTQTGSLLAGSEGKSVYKSEIRSQKTHGMCFLKEKQAEKHKPEADRQVEKGKVCEKARLEVRKHTACAF